ncbi:hypothetical protein [Paenibacillus sp. CMAA1364]
MGASFNSKKRNEKIRISSKKKCKETPAPKLSPQQISIIAALLAGYFNIDSVIYTRDNVLQVLLTTDNLTELPILGPPRNPSEVDLMNAIDVISSNEGRF